ncbi:hypothetical protein LC065_10285 [Halobacillus litoralis]|uniref:hypothetical protein n=1 Tax=Halobacillus litoralis TaxID=45668 RepID=UPI001CFE7314|nr:hypothetical protein [Halobacillus litoralis]WLR46012.1 hypothetical protein LC065_10285 [Halobacillus litoralis]
MNKRIIIGLISGTVLIWASVLTVFILTSDTNVLESGEHGFTRSMTMGKNLNDQSTADFFERNQGVENATRTIIGEKTLTKDWVHDVREDGKLSIDTLLESLELNDTDNS